MATVTVAARYESVTAARVTHPWLDLRQLSHELLQLSDLVELFHLLGSSDVPTADKHSRQLRRLGRILLAGGGEDPLQLRRERRVHREIPLVDSHGEAAEDRGDGSAGLERGTNHAEAGEVDDDAALRAGDRNAYSSIRFGLLRIWFGIATYRLGICAEEEVVRGTSRPGSEDKIRGADSVEDSGDVVGRGRGRSAGRRREGRGIVGAEVVDVFEGGGGREGAVNLNRRFAPRPPH